jgi:hypothetical protein
MWAVTWSARQDLLAWLECHNAAPPAWWRARHCADRQPEDRGRGGRRTLGGAQRGLRVYANQMGFLIDLCRIRQPGDKGKVEPGAGAM